MNRREWRQQNEQTIPWAETQLYSSMPCVRVFTNVEAEKPAQIAFLKELSATIAKLLNKPEGLIITIPC